MNNPKSKKEMPDKPTEGKKPNDSSKKPGKSEEPDLTVGLQNLNLEKFLRLWG